MDTNSKKYRTILADPPWQINQRGKNSNRSAEHHYDLMPLERIKAMPVVDFSMDNSYLYLWCPACFQRRWKSSKRGGSHSAVPSTGSSPGSDWEITSETQVRPVSLLLAARLQ